MYWLAFSYGLLGSLHCLLMCGPLMVSIKTKRYQEFSSSLFYQSGRLVTYILLGLLSFVFGLSIEYFVGQRFISLFIGVSIIALYWFFRLTKGKSIVGGSANVDAFKFIRKPFSKFIQKASLVNSFFLGILNGLLPCGLVYLALATASVTPSMYEAATFMLFFGAGTLPMTMFVQIGGRKVQPSLGGIYQKVLPYFIHAVAMLLIVRGLGLGVPYLSPLIQQTVSGIIRVCGG